MHEWIRNPKAPRSLWDGLVLDGAYAGLHPGTDKFRDGSGLGNDGTLTNMDPLTDWVWSPEINRQGLDLRLQNPRQYILTSPLVIADGPSTLSYWIRHDGNADGYGYIIFGQTTAGTFWQHVSATSFVVQSRSVTISSTAIKSSDWRHFALVSNGAASGLKSVYLNGTLIGTKTDTGTALPVGANTWIIGAWTSNEMWRINGTISDSLFHSRPLATAEIQWLANPANRLYVPDTRRVVAFSPHAFSHAFPPWLIRRRRRNAGAR